MLFYLTFTIIIIITKTGLVFSNSTFSAESFENDALNFANFRLPISLSDIQSMTQLTGECRNDLESLVKDFEEGEVWAIQMIDASAKPQSGIFVGNIMHVGNYDECLAVEGPQGVKGKYCTAFFEPHEEYGLQLLLRFSKFFMNSNFKIEEEKQLPVKTKKSFGFCVPKSCNIQDLTFFTNYTEYKLKSPLHFIFEEDLCGGKDFTFSSGTIVAITVFSFFGIMIVVSTVYDVLASKSEERDNHRTMVLFFIHFHPAPPPEFTIIFYASVIQWPETYSQRGHKLYSSFSLLKNIKKLFAVHTVKNNTLGCLNGLKVISMMWLMIAHGYLYQLFFPLINTSYIFEWKKHTGNSFIIGSHFAVDTFFTISGLLVVFRHLEDKEKNIPFSLPKFYIHRFFRIFPSLAMLVLLSSTLIEYMGSGPVWIAITDLFYKPCEYHWWSTLLFLQNYVHTYDECVGQAWYLAVEMQMYCLSPFVLYLLVRWPKTTIAAIFVFVGLNCGYVFWINWTKQLGVLFFNQGEEHKYIYSPTHIRGTVYLIGMVCGYFIFHCKYIKAYKLCKWNMLALWILSLLVLLGIILWYSVLIKDEPTLIHASLFNSLTRVLWSMALSIIILLCINGYGGLINTFLSSKVFTFLVRVNYNVYLLHLLVMLVVHVQSRRPDYFSNISMFHKFWGDYAFSMVAAAIWYLGIESPMVEIEKVVTGDNEKTRVVKFSQDLVISNMGRS